jgi:hypothetical protein
MNQMARLVLTIPMPKLAAVEVVRHLVVRVTWAEGIRSTRVETVDLSPLINSLKFYRPLREDETLFNSVHLIEDGKILAWGEDDEIDMPADSVEQLAEESWTSNDLRDFLNSNKLTHQEIAALLGYSRRQIENFLSGDELIPRVVVMACFGLQTRRQTQNTNSSNLRVLYTTTADLTLRKPADTSSNSEEIPLSVAVGP